MSLLDKMEKRFGFLAVQNLTLYLVAGQVLTFAMMALRNDEFAILRHMVFYFDAFASGEVWRVVSFLLIPPRVSWFWIAFAWIVFYLMGTSLEGKWGAFRYNLYLLTAVVGVVIAGAFFPTVAVTNQYIAYSVTFGFAYLFPNFELRLFFILPVKMKWLALAIGGLLLLQAMASPLPIRFFIVGSLINFPLFFGLDIFRSLKARKRVAEMKEAKRKFEEQPFHVCVKCGATDLSAPERDFRYDGDGALCSVCLEEGDEDEASSKG